METPPAGAMEPAALEKSQAEPAPVVSATETQESGLVAPPADGLEEQMALVLDRPDLSPSQKADMLLGRLRQSPVEQQFDLIRHIASLYPDKEWARYREILADQSIDVEVRATALESLGRDRPAWLMVEAVSTVLTNPADPLRPVANQTLKKIYPSSADYDLNAFRALARQDYANQAKSTGKENPW